MADGEQAHKQMLYPGDIVGASSFERTRGGNGVKVSMTINGQKQEHEVEPRLLLVHYIREVVGLTGTNIGCDSTSCGACTVLLDGESVKSCTVLAAQAALDNNHRQKELQSSKIAQAQANIKATNADVERTRLERVREEELEKTGSSTHQKLEQAVADEERLRATLISRQAELETQRREVAVLDAQETQLKADMSAKEAAVKLARINLDYTRIVAPTDGIVGERKVRAGQLVSPGTQVISLVGQTVWVVANYKETQLRNVRAGDKADVIVDGVPGVVFTGRVETVSPASGSQFSLLPPDNATGNFTKIAQRIPVKIVLDPKQALTERLRPGMSVIATIKTTP